MEEKISSLEVILAGKGCKARGGLPNQKWIVRRHGGGNHGKRKRGASACEKALETVERRAARMAIQEGFSFYEDEVEHGSYV